MRHDLDDLKELIDCIQAVYTEVTNRWMSAESFKINLKKSLVADIDVEGQLYRHMMSYAKMLNEVSLSITPLIAGASGLPVTARVKAANSIVFKLQNYKTEKHQFGRVSVNKCFNDLFGVRVILGTPLDFETIFGFIEKTYQGKFRCIDSSKLDYCAVHLYFKENNLTFPWKLQIWDSAHVASNLASHRRYKQGYTEWEQDSEGGGVVYD